MGSGRGFSSRRGRGRSCGCRLARKRGELSRLSRLRQTAAYLCRGGRIAGLRPVQPSTKGGGGVTGEGQPTCRLGSTHGTPDSLRRLPVLILEGRLPEGLGQVGKAFGVRFTYADERITNQQFGEARPAYVTSSRGWERLTGERAEPEPPRRAPLRRIAVRIRPARRVCGPIARTTVQSWRSGRPTRRQPPVEQRATARVTRVGTRPSRSSSMVSPSRRSEPRRLSSSYAQPQSGSVAPV